MLIAYYFESVERCNEIFNHFNDYNDIYFVEKREFGCDLLNKVFGKDVTSIIKIYSDTKNNDQIKKYYNLCFLYIDNTRKEYGTYWLKFSLKKLCQKCKKFKSRWSYSKDVRTCNDCNQRISFGKFRGHRFCDVYKKERNYCEYIKKMEYNNKDLYKEEPFNAFKSWLDKIDETKL